MLLPSRRRRQRGLAGLLCVNVLGSLAALAAPAAAALPSQEPGVTLSARRARTGGVWGRSPGFGWS